VPRAGNADLVSELLKTLVVLGARGDMTGRLLLPALVRLAGSGGLPDGLLSGSKSWPRCLSCGFKLRVRTG
jgi:hypothetical protein